ncbi:caspase, EACC1-associated type [Saccharothrix syringae]|uniref:Peptidase C14 caspase domain-containing protein n=1 Tax=Saccharothrix syringae TaxID=103733 RepID=A0A5Q0HAM5_SACSY|nr:caspase family protein [Saccharothrix syringae]QFZ23296.1 hypothetical protein EKG83_42900 [Saccharothrix syringae]
MRTALLIATDSYSDPAFSALRAPGHDVASLRAVLADPAIGAFRTQVLVNRPAQEVRERVEDLFATAGLDDLVLLYLSGHGVKDRQGRLHFAATDTRADRLRTTGVPAELVRELIHESRSRKVVVLLDCCYSGAFPAGMRPKGGAVDVAELVEGRGCAVITSSTHLQHAFEPDGTAEVSTGPASVFTGVVVEGLRTGAADVDGDGAVTARDLYDYVHEHVRRLTPHQTPTSGGVVSGDLLVAHAPRRPAGGSAVRVAAAKALGDLGDPERAAAVLRGAAGGPAVAPPREYRFPARLDGKGGPVAFSPDSSLLAAAGTVWDTRTWQPASRLPRHDRPRAFSPDGHLLAVAGPRGISLRSTAAWHEVRFLPALARYLRFSHDGGLLVAWRPGTLSLWEAADGTWQSAPPAWEGVWAVDVSRSSPRLAVIGMPRDEMLRVELFDTSTRQLIARHPLREAEAMGLSPDGGLVALSSSTATVVLRTVDWAPVAELHTPSALREPGPVFVDDSTLAVHAHHGLELWDLPTRTRAFRLETDLEHLDFSPDGRFAAVSDRNGPPRVWARDRGDLGPLPIDPAPPVTPAERVGTRWWRRVVNRARPT